MLAHLHLHRSFQQGFGELLENVVLAEDVLRLLIVFEQLVN
jgi:hypothetical protein